MTEVAAMGADAITTTRGSTDNLDRSRVERRGFFVAKMKCVP